MRKPQVLKETILKRFASIRFDGVLASAERDDATRILGSAGARVTSWNAGVGRTYATLLLDMHADLACVSDLPGAICDEPPLVVLRVRPDALRSLPALERTFAGPGRPAGVREVRRDDTTLIVEFDARQTPLAFVVATIDVELATASGRTIEPLVGLDDITLAAFAGAELGESDLDLTRLIETYLEPLFESGVA